MMFLKLLLLFGVTVNPVKIYESKSILVDKDLVLMENPTGPTDALRVKVESKYKFFAVRATRLGDGRPSNVRKLDVAGEFIITGTPGTYSITVFESDPELGINLVDVEAVLGEKPTTPPPTDPPPTDPTDPPPTDQTRLYEVALELAKRVNDPDTAKELALAYDTIATKADFKPEELQQARRQVLMFRKNTKSKWDTFLKEVDVACGEDVSREDLKTIAKALRNVST